MDKNFLVIDGGTSNTRIYYVRNEEILDVFRIPFGVRVSIDEPGKLPWAVKRGVDELNQRHGKADCILAAGMITSELGLYQLPHLVLPAGIRELHKGMARVSLPEIADIPFYFIPGLKEKSEVFTECDMMRGEECEIIGLMRPEDGNCAYVLPGSHSKLVYVDQNGKVVHFTTMLTGEMIAALSSGTILKSSVDLKQPIKEASLLKGCQTAREMGLNAALFKARIMDTLFRADPADIYSYFLGAVLWGEMEQLIRSDAPKIILAGQQQLAKASARILKALSDKRVILADEELAQNANVRGMLRIFAYSETSPKRKS